MAGHKNVSGFEKSRSPSSIVATSSRVQAWRTRSSPAKGWAAARPVVDAREGRSRAREEIRRKFLYERKESFFFFFEKRNRAEDMNLRAEALSGRAACE